MRDKPYVVLLGDFTRERVSLAEMAEPFGFQTIQIPNLADLSAFGETRVLAAVFIHLAAMELSWEHTLQAAQNAGPPGARVILCHGPILFPTRDDMTASGAFHPVMTPLDATETHRPLDSYGQVFVA